MEHFPRHWDVAEDRVQDPNGRTFRLRIWGWSTSSAGQAAIAARQRLADVVQTVRSGRPLGQGYYHRMPMREEVLQEIRSTTGELIGIISRNSYGAEILNTDRLLIADVDDPDAADSRPARGLARLFRRRSPEPEPDPSASPVLARIEEFARTRTHLGVHTYRTAAGFRVLITGAQAPPDSEHAAEILTALAADPLYARLCATHNTYRARLTPKPWRAGLRALTRRWPWADARAEQDAARWVQRYQARGADYAVCRRLRSGSAGASAEEQLLLRVHDEAVLGPAEAPLA